MVVFLLAQKPKEGSTPSICHVNANGRIKNEIKSVAQILIKKPEKP